MLQLKNITKKYVTGDTEVHALKGINLQFRKNEFVSVLGPSGCGKTTMLNIIGGLDKYTTGDLVINGVSTVLYKDSDWDNYRNHSIGFVFQSYNLIPHQTVLGNVELALTLSGVGKKEKRERAVKALQQVGLGDQLNKLPNQLSGGQMQRVAIARAIVNDPEIVLADEPTGALDSETSIQVMQLLKEIAADRLVIMVTHNPELAARYSSRIVRLLDGEVIEAGSIGIIGIALILSLSAGFQDYIYDVQQDTLSNYPLTINSTNVDMASFLQASGSDNGIDAYPDDDTVHSNNFLGDIFSSMTGSIMQNDLKSLKKYLEENVDPEKISGIKYTYDFNYNIYTADGYKLNPYEMPDVLKQMLQGNNMASLYESMMKSAKTWSEMMDNEVLIQSQYSLLSGKWPSSAGELVVVVDKYNSIPDYNLYQMGFKSENELIYSVMEMLARQQLPEGASDEEIHRQAVAMMQAMGIEYEESEDSFSFDDIIGTEYKILLDSDYFTESVNSDGQKIYVHTPDADMSEKLQSAFTLKIVGIVRLNENVSSGAISTPVAYTSALTDYIINATSASAPVAYQRANPDIDVTTGKPFESGRTMDNVLSMMGVADKDQPSSISIYPTSFENKDYIIGLIDEYNSDKPSDQKISYTDYVGVMMDSVTVIINAITYVLIAFVSISLVVSSIMIGIITYISVLERTKEIGILRSIGASKRDISRVFNAETILVGLFAGIIGIGVTILLNVTVINPVIASLAHIYNVAGLPWIGGIILVAISVMLTLVAGLIPSGIAARKDPVVALRTE